MLNPTGSPEEYRELEKEIAQPPTETLSPELRTRVMGSVRKDLGRKITRSSSRSVLAGVFAIAAGLVLVVTLSNNDLTTPTETDNAVRVPAENDPHPRALPTLQHYRLAIHGSPADWESLLHNEADRFADLGGNPRALKWRSDTPPSQND